MASDAPAQERGAEPLERFWERARRLIQDDPARAHPRTSKQTQQELARLITLRVDAEVYGASTPLLGAIDLAIGALGRVM